jgi:hypothetical protein
MMVNSEVPFAAPLIGYVTDFEQNSDPLPSLIAVSTISLNVLVFAVSLRLYTKFTKREKILWEDCKQSCYF